MYSCECQVGECVLCEAHLFSGLSGEQVCSMQSLIFKRSYEAGTLIFQAGEPGIRLYILKSGQVKLTTSLPDGREQILGVRVAGHLLGFESVEDKVYPYSAQAVTPVEVCTIKFSSMMRVLEHNPEVSIKVIRLLNNEIERSQALIRDLGLKSANEKVASFILSLVPLNGDIPDKIALPLTRQEIASMLGLTVETVSRVMAEMKRNRIIEAPRGAVVISDPQRLRIMAGIKPDPGSGERAVGGLR